MRGRKTSGWRRSPSGTGTSINFFSAMSLRRLMARCGLEVLDLRPATLTVEGKKSGSGGCWPSWPERRWAGGGLACPPWQVSDRCGSHAPRRRWQPKNWRMRSTTSPPPCLGGSTCAARCASSSCCIPRGQDLGHLFRDVRPLADDALEIQLVQPQAHPSVAACTVARRGSPVISDISPNRRPRRWT